MALGLRWYDSFCLAIVAAAVLVAFWMIKKREGGCRLRESDRSEYESLLSLATRNGDRVDLPPLAAAAAPRSGHLRYDQLWQSCWQGVHPAVLLVLRLFSAAAMAAILSWDILRYGSSILLYYTEAMERFLFSAGVVAVPDYWVRWQTAVCAVIIVALAAAAVAVLDRARARPVRAVDLWAPCWVGLHPAWLLAYRGLVFLGMAWLLSQMILYRGFAAFYFFTQWTFALVIVYFAVATVISAHGCWFYSKRCITEDEEANIFLKGTVEQDNSVTLPFITNKDIDAIRLQNNCEEEVDCKRAGFWGYAMQLIYQTSAGAVMLTDIVFWVLLVPFLSSEHFGVNAIMGCMHSLNAVFLLIDTFLNNLPFPWFRMAYFILWSCVYVIFQWVLHACGFSWWPYPFLELNTPWAPLWYFAMAVMHVPCYVLYWLIVRAKNHFLPKFFPNDFVRTY